MTIPYVYKMININTDEFYIGCRYSEGCHPEESFDIYASSSKLVKDRIRRNPNEWKKIVLYTGNPEKVLLEESSLIKMNINHSLCLNGRNIDGLINIRKKKIKNLPAVDESDINKRLETISSKIKSSRIEQDITCEQLAKAIGIARTTLARIEQGSGNSEISSILKAIQILNIKDIF